MPGLDDIAKVVAYQRSPLAEMQRLYETLHFDLNDYLVQEQRFAEEIRELQKGFTELTKALESGEITPEAKETLPPFPNETLNSIEISVKKRYERLDVNKSENFDQLLKNAENYLREHGIDTQKDPLLQVLDSREIATIRESYEEKYGEIAWDPEDYLAIILAGFVATLVDLLIIRIPGPGNVFKTLPQGYALTTWIKERSQQMARSHEAGESGGKPQKLKDAEQDPIFTFILSLSDLARAPGNALNQNHKQTTTLSASASSQSNLLLMVTKGLLQLLSVVFTSAGIQPPFGSLLSLVRQESSAAGKTSDKNVTWTHVTGYMQQQGFDLKQLLLLGIVPAAVDIIIKGYWLFRLFDHPEEEEQMNAKITSMLMLGHTIALSGNFAKTGVLYQMNPFVLSWERIFGFFPVLFSWIAESLEREYRIKTKMGEEWVRLYKQIEQFHDKGNSTW